MSVIRSMLTLIIVTALWVAATPGARAAALETTEQTREASPQQVTLQRLLEQAIQRNPGLQAKKRAYEAARARVIAAWLPNDPEIGTDVEGQSHLFRFDRTDNEYSIMQRVPFPTTLFLRATAATNDADIAYQQYKEQERDVIWHIEQPYYELFLAKGTLGSLEEIRQLLERLSGAIQARYESNQSSQQDLLKARIELAKLGIELVDWEQKAHLGEAHVSHILNQPLHTSYEVLDSPTIQPLELSREQLEERALHARPELKAFGIGIQRAKISRAMALTSWLPDVTGRIEARQFSGEGHIREYDTFIGVTVPVWSLLKGAVGEWKGAQREVQAAEAMYEQQKNEVRLAVHEAYAKVTTAEYGLHAYQELILPQAKQQVEVAMAAYESGRTDLLALIDAQRTLKDSQIAFHQVAAEYQLGLSDLRLAVGSDLK